MKSNIPKNAKFVLPEPVFTNDKQKYYPSGDDKVKESLEKWQDYKFGLLMHWGTYSRWGVVESWSLCPEDEDWCKRKGNDYNKYVKDYENLQNTFNPTDFAPDKWAKAGKNAGMKYMIFTTKHHDGFCMFDTKTTDYKITSDECPYHKNDDADVLKACFDAFRAEGFSVGAYFSKPDWHNDDYWWKYFPVYDRNPNYDINKYPKKWDNFVKFTHKQIDELMTNYGKVDILWLDGGWVNCVDAPEPSAKFKQVNHQSQDIKMQEIAKNARNKQPGILIVDRAVEGPFQDYLTPENTIPDEPLGVPWETNLVSGGGYSYTPNAKYKAGKEVIKILIDIVAKGGNLLLNIAPSPLGDYDEAAYKMLNQIGNWMNVNGNCIYNTRSVTPYKQDNIYFTHSRFDGILYAIYIRDEEPIPDEVVINNFKLKATEIGILGTNKTIPFAVSSDKLTIDISKIDKTALDKTAFVFAIETKANK